MLCGALTGFCLSFIETPIGLILGQIHGHLNRRHTHAFDFSIKDCGKYIYENNGGLKGFYKGYFSTLISSIPTSMFYFGGYEYIKKHLYQRQHRLFLNKNKNTSLRLNILLSGAIGGLVACTICYPLDIIRLEIQADDLRPGHRKYTSYFDCIKQIYEEHHTIKTFYRGFFPGILKAIPINAACFLAYEEHYCSTSQLLLHWFILLLCCIVLASIIGICYNYYRYDGGEMMFEYKIYLPKDNKKEEEEENDIV